MEEERDAATLIVNEGHIRGTRGRFFCPSRPTERRGTKEPSPCPPFIVCGKSWI